MLLAEIQDQFVIRIGNDTVTTVCCDGSFVVCVAALLSVNCISSTMHHLFRSTCVHIIRIADANSLQRLCIQTHSRPIRNHKIPCFAVLCIATNLRCYGWILIIISQIKQSTILYTHRSLVICCISGDRNIIQSQVSAILDIEQRIGSTCQ